MPITSTFYDWIPHEKARYITVRPYSPPRGGVAADDSKNPYFWNLSSGMIGRSEADRAKFRDYVLRNRGRVWIIGNEPEVTSQDNLTPTQYAQMYRTYYSTVSQLDPSATFAIASVGQVTYHAEFDKVKPYYDAIFAEYKRLYGVDLPFHYWNLHAYYAGWAPSHASTPTSMVDAVFTKLINPYIAYAQTVSNGRYKSNKILATEVGFAWPNDNALGISEAAGIEFMRLYTNRLVSGVNEGTFLGFFWFYGGWAGEPYFHSSLIDSSWKKPTAIGLAYAQQARAWDREHGVERADFTRDAKINIFDVNRLVKGFGTTDAALSLDTNPKVTTNDLTLFKQVWNFLK